MARIRFQLPHIDHHSVQGPSAWHSLSDPDCCAEEYFELAARFLRFFFLYVSGQGIWIWSPVAHASSPQEQGIKHYPRESYLMRQRLSLRLRRKWKDHQADQVHESDRRGRAPEAAQCADEISG